MSTPEQSSQQENEAQAVLNLMATFHAFEQIVSGPGSVPGPEVITPPVLVVPDAPEAKLSSSRSPGPNYAGLGPQVSSLLPSPKSPDQVAGTVPTPDAVNDGKAIKAVKDAEKAALKKAEADAKKAKDELKRLEKEKREADAEQAAQLRKELKLQHEEANRKRHEENVARKQKEDEDLKDRVAKGKASWSDKVIFKRQRTIERTALWDEAKNKFREDYKKLAETPKPGVTPVGFGPSTEYETVGNPDNLFAHSDAEPEQPGRLIEDFTPAKRQELIEEFETDEAFRDFYNLSKVIALKEEKQETKDIDPGNKKLTILTAARGTRFFTDLHEHVYQRLNQHRLYDEFKKIADDQVPFAERYGAIANSVTFGDYIADINERISLNVPEIEEKAKELAKKRVVGFGPRFLWRITDRQAWKKQTRLVKEVEKDKGFTSNDGHLLAILEAAEHRERVEWRGEKTKDAKGAILSKDQRKVMDKLRQLREINSPEWQVYRKKMIEGLKIFQNDKRMQNPDEIAKMIREVNGRQGWWNDASKMLLALEAISIARQLGATTLGKFRNDPFPTEGELIQTLSERADSLTGSPIKWLKRQFANRADKKGTGSGVLPASEVNPVPEAKPIEKTDQQKAEDTLAQTLENQRAASKQSLPVVQAQIRLAEGELDETLREEMDVAALLARIREERKRRKI